MPKSPTQYNFKWRRGVLSILHGYFDMKQWKGWDASTWYIYQEALSCVWWREKKGETLEEKYTNLKYLNPMAPQWIQGPMSMQTQIVDICNNLAKLLFVIKSQENCNIVICNNVVK